MNEHMERGAENRLQEVCVMMNVCPVFCGIAGRCCTSQHQCQSCQPPYVMKLHPCHSMTVKCAVTQSPIKKYQTLECLWEIMNGICLLSFLIWALNVSSVAVTGSAV